MEPPQAEPPAPAPPAGSRSSRTRFLYRELARLFHPDSSPLDDRAEAEAHWHLLQEAQRSDNLVELEKLYAASAHWISPSQPTLALRWDPLSFRNGLEALRSEWHVIQTTEAWVFWHAADRERFCNRLKAHTARRVQQCRLQLRRLEAKIHRWKSPAPVEPSSPWRALRKALRHEGASPAALQTAFPFGS